MTLTRPASPPVAPNPAAMADEKAKTVIEAAAKSAEQNEAAAEQAKAEVNNRRENVAQKDFREDKPVDVQKATMHDAMREQQLARSGPKTFTFISKFPDLNIYVNMGDSEREPGGQMIRRDKRVQFKRGTYTTTDPREAAMIRRHPACGTQVFRETEDESVFHLRRAAAARRASMDNPTFAGPTSSLDGGEMGILQGQRELAQLEERLMNGGA